MRKTTLVAAAAVLLCAMPSRADRRAFVFMYEPRTLAQGELEVEYYMTAAIVRDRLLGEHLWNWGHQVEVEYGVTDRFDLSMYQMFGAAGWNGWKARARWRPWDYGVMPVDLMLYGEFIQDKTGDFKFEEKVVVGRRFGRLVTSLDSTFEQGPFIGDTGYSLSESLGIGYEFAPWFIASLESSAKMSWQPRTVYTSTTPELAFSGVSLYAGPTLSFARGDAWIDVGLAARAVGDEDQSRFLFRILWGIFL